MTSENTTLQLQKARKVRDGYLVATAKLHSIGDQQPYFSVTGELWDSEGWYRNGQDGRLREAGRLHDRILKAFPSLAPLVRLHLSDEDGVPMYAEENGWYWYSDVDGPGMTVRNSDFLLMTPRDRAAHYLRVSPDELPHGLDRAAFTAFVYGLRPRWKAEADAAKQLFTS